MACILLVIFLFLAMLNGLTPKEFSDIMINAYNAF